MTFLLNTPTTYGRSRLIEFIYQDGDRATMNWSENPLILFLVSLQLS
ncbi:hypothetical protein [Crinalium epipsammum]|nr:hypothetical protein [Crinalium epipsammum]